MPEGCTPPNTAGHFSPSGGTDRRVRRTILVVGAASALVVAVGPRVAAASISSRRTDVVVGLFAAAVVLLSARRLVVHRLGLAAATVGALLWSALATHPFEGPTIYVLPGELGLGLHVSDVVLGVAIVGIAVRVDRQLCIGSTSSAPDAGAGATSSDR